MPQFGHMPDSATNHAGAGEKSSRVGAVGLHHRFEGGNELFKVTEGSRESHG